MCIYFILCSIQHTNDVDKKKVVFQGNEFIGFINHRIDSAMKAYENACKSRLLDNIKVDFLKAKRNKRLLT